MGALSLLLLLELFFLQAALLLPELGPAVLEPHLGTKKGTVRRREKIRSGVVVQWHALG